MSDSIPCCPKCSSVYAYIDGTLYVCPECGYEWNEEDSAFGTDEFVVNDANGNRLSEGDNVTLIKDLRVKGSSATAKIGTKVKINRLVEGDHNIDCRIDGIGAMMLKSEFVKKA